MCPVMQEGVLLELPDTIVKTVRKQAQADKVRQFQSDSLVR